MRARSLSLGALALSAALPLSAQERFSTPASPRTAAQSAAEVQDIGEITEAGPAVESDGKTVSTETPVSPNKFRVSASTRAQYFSNAQLSGNHGSGDFLFFPTIEAGYNVPLRHGFTLDVAARLESGLYARYDDRGFIGYGATATLDWRPRPTAPRIFLGIEPYRYDNFDIGGLLTQAIGFSAGTDWGIPFNNGNSAAFIGYNFTHYLSDPSKDDRNSNRAVLGVTHTIRPQLYAQLFYMYSYDVFTEFDRHDSRHTVGANLTWQVNRQLFATLSGSFVDSDSTQEHASYQAAGVGIQLTWQY